MKKRLSTVKLNALVFVLLYCLMSLQAFAQTEKPFSLDESPLPAPVEPINDYAGVLDENTKQTLNRRIKNFKAKTNPPVVLAVAIVKSTGERPIYNYSLAVSRGWKIGTKDDDNPSALLFIAIDDRKYFTQVSRNLEDELPDGLIGQLQRQNLVPAFKQGDYGKGVSDTIEAYIRTIEARQSGQPVAPEANAQDGKSGSAGGLCNIVTCLIILFILMIIIFSRGGSNRNKNDRNRWGGGGGFGGGGSALPWIIGGVLGGGGGGSSSAGVLPSSKWKKGLGIAFKIEDGDDKRARAVVVIEILRRLGILDAKNDERLREYSPIIIINRLGDKVGEVTTDFDLKIKRV